MKGAEKLLEFRRNIASLHGTYDVIIITETWLDDTVSDAELGLSGYQIFRRDRSILTSSKEKGEGVLIAVRDGIDVTPFSSVKSLELQYELVKGGNSSLLINTIYLPPDATIDSYKLYADSLIKAKKKFPAAKLILVGDYNLPNIK